MASYLDDHQGGGSTDREPFNVRVNSRVVKDGRHTLTFELTDLAGNTASPGGLFTSTTRHRRSR
jgi:hypothetical protein